METSSLSVSLLFLYFCRLQSLLTVSTDVVSLFPQNFNIFPELKPAKANAKFLRFPGMDTSGRLVSFGMQVKLPQQVDDAFDALQKAAAESKK